MRLAAVLTVAALALSGPGATPGERAKETVRLIASFGPRPAGEPGADARVAKLVAGRLRGLGYRIVVQRIRLPNGGTTENVVGLTSSRPQVVIVAHKDGVRDSPAANDNGSGVAVLLEVARALRGRPGVLVGALGAEERVVTGSRLHLGSAGVLQGISPAGRRRIRLALSLDMVGVGTTLNVRGLEPAPNRSAALTLAVARRLGLGASYRQDTGESDHAEMTRAGLPAAWIEWRRDRCWHSPCDVASRVEPHKLGIAYALTVASAREALGA